MVAAENLLDALGKIDRSSGTAASGASSKTIPRLVLVLTTRRVASIASQDRARRPRGGRPVERLGDRGRAQEEIDEMQSGQIGVTDGRCRAFERSLRAGTRSAPAGRG